MATFIHFLISNNERIIYLTATAICVLGIVVIWWQVFGKRSLKTGEKPEVDLESIEESLKKILAQTNFAIQNVGGAAAGGADTGAAAGGATGAAGAAGAKIDGIMSLDGKPVTDIGGVKTELQVRARIIEELQKQVKAAKGDAAPTELLAKIKDLEGKLAEYEIIEDDIADLSFFKEENAKLKKELESLKRADPKLIDQFAEQLEKEKAAGDAVAEAAEGLAEGAAVADVGAAAAVADVPAAAAVADVSTEDVSAEDILAQAVSEIPVVDAPSAPAQTDAPATLEQLDEVAAPVEVGGGSIDDAVAEAQKQLGVEAGGESSGAEAPADISLTENNEEAKADIFGEFEKDGEIDPMAELGEIDPDRMLDELKELNADMTAGAEALDEAPDIEKMAHEAKNLNKKG